jgi:pyrroline-5-carboxylate reductase
VANARLIRALTNTPSAICHAATAISRGTRAGNQEIEPVREIFEAIGIVVEVEENQLDVVTALAGSGPAFVYSMIEALADGGIRMGLGSGVALSLATQTVLGAAQLASQTKFSPNELREMVVTPGGTTAAGLEAMKRFRTNEGLIAAVEAATKRAEEMAEENS